MRRCPYTYMRAAAEEKPKTQHGKETKNNKTENPPKARPPRSGCNEQTRSDRYIGLRAWYSGVERHHCFEIEPRIGNFPMEQERTPGVPGSQCGPGVAQRTLKCVAFAAE